MPIPQSATPTRAEGKPPRKTRAQKEVEITVDAISTPRPRRSNQTPKNQRGDGVHAHRHRVQERDSTGGDDRVLAEVIGDQREIGDTRRRSARGSQVEPEHRRQPVRWLAIRSGSLRAVGDRGTAARRSPGSPGSAGPGPAGCQRPIGSRLARQTRIRATRSGPETAPTWSSASCNPKPRPCPIRCVACESIASRRRADRLAHPLGDHQPRGELPAARQRQQRNRQQFTRSPGTSSPSTVRVRSAR